MSYLLTQAAYLDPQRRHDLCLNAANLRESNQDDADFRTRAARAEIAKLAQYMSGQEAIALLSSLVNAFGVSMALRTSCAAANALDSILDAVGTLEDAEAIDG